MPTESYSNWLPWFAWRPVYVDAYAITELRHGRTRYKVWLRTVEYQFFDWIDGEDDPDTHRVIRYRLPPRRMN